MVLFRYGVAVMIGLSPDEQTAFMATLKPRTIREFARYEEELAQVQICDDFGEPVQPGGPICLKSFSNDRLLVVADALAKGTVLTHDERRVSAVFDVIEPFAQELAEHVADFDLLAEVPYHRDLAQAYHAILNDGDLQSGFIENDRVGGDLVARCLTWDLEFNRAVDSGVRAPSEFGISTSAASEGDLPDVPAISGIGGGMLVTSK